MVAKAPEPEADIDALAGSALFKKSPGLRNLLLYLWERRGQSISEYAIGVEALGRRPEFDPRGDATVRVSISRLRQKLREYYESEGREAVVRVEIPVGRHEIQVVAGEPPPVPEVTSPRQPLLLGLTAVALLLVVAVSYLFIQNRRLQAHAVQASPAALPALWKHFLGPAQSATIVFPTPAFFNFEASRMSVRVTQIPEWRDFEKSDPLRSLTKQFGPYQPNQTYSVASDTRAIGLLAPYLVSHGIDLKVESTASLPAAASPPGLLILLGIPHTNPRMNAFLDTAQFKTDGGLAVIENPNPKADERSVYRREVFGRVREVHLGLILARHDRAKGTRTLILASTQAHGIAFLLTSPGGLQRLMSMLPADIPDQFDVVVEAELNGATLLDVRPLTWRAGK